MVDVLEGLLLNGAVTATEICDWLGIPEGNLVGAEPVRIMVLRRCQSRGKESELLEKYKDHTAVGFAANDRVESVD